MGEKWKHVSVEPPEAFPDARYEVYFQRRMLGKSYKIGWRHGRDITDDPARAAAVDAIVARIRERKKHA